MTPAVLVVLPSTAVHAMRLKRRKSGEVCSVPITTYPITVLMHSKVKGVVYQLHNSGLQFTDVWLA